MLYAGAGILAILILLAVIFRRFSIGQIKTLMPKSPECFLYPLFYRLGTALYKDKHKQDSSTRKVHPLDNPDEVYALRCIKIGRYIYYACVLVAFIAIVTDYGIKPEYKIEDGYYIRREADDGMEDSVQAQVIGDEMAGQDMTIHIRDKFLEGKEREALFKSGEEYVKNRMLGENESLLEVRKRLELISEIPETSMKVSWDLSDTLSILTDGNLDNLELNESGEDQTISFALIYGGETRVYPLTLRVYPPAKTEEEKFLEAVYDAIDVQNEDTENEDRLKLPSDVQGHHIVWQEKSADLRKELLLFAMLGIIVFGIYTFQDEKRAMEVRKQQLAEDYPVFIHKLVLMNSAGMNMQTALSAMVSEQEKQYGKKMHYVYKEIDVALRLMSQGVAEVKAYELFGKNCDSALYMKLASMMVQCVKKGASGMNDLMSEMAAEALMMRKDMVRQNAEKTSTRLLLPMGMLLVVVFAILILPAFLSMKL